MLRREEVGEWVDIHSPHPSRAPLLNRSFLTTSPGCSNQLPPCPSTAYTDLISPLSPTPSPSLPWLHTSCILFNVSLALYLHNQDQDLPVRQVEVMAGSARSRKLKWRRQVHSKSRANQKQVTNETAVAGPTASQLVQHNSVILRFITDAKKIVITDNVVQY